MDYLCDFIIENINICVDRKIVGEDYSCDELNDIKKCISIITSKLNINDIYFKCQYEDTEQIKIISFKYKNRQCEIYEIYGYHNDYLGVCLMPI